MKAMLQQAIEAEKEAATSLAESDANFALGQRDRMLRPLPRASNIVQGLGNTPVPADTTITTPQSIMVVHITRRVWRYRGRNAPEEREVTAHRVNTPFQAASAEVTAHGVRYTPPQAAPEAEKGPGPGPL